ncbi:glycosyltransferase family 2 protein [Actinotalea ferrariae]|uniref:glycosyltransferase family 2 protein n=1 Tax=Actinotalea ferrariae TaxID=1386098 RepID=UPI001C8BFFD0|nr:glycosyltransferase family 2 protein [Actinotalea ferrariae]MBX9246436.1 glycosyltransferase family 2 protein [Actinotalea ferrariae]
MNPRASVLMLAYGAEPYLGEAVAAVLASRDVELELLLVDNGCTSDAVERLPADARVRVLRPGTNLGFTGGVDLAAREAVGDVLVLVNSDAVVDATCVAVLCLEVEDERIGVAGATVLLADQPGVVNSAGNPLHVLGLSWAGWMGRPVDEVPARRTVASASGATLAVRRSLWNELGGFPEPYFAYLEDLELSWRCHQRGLDVVVLREATSSHYYEFSRSPLKMYLVERNRLLVLATCHEARTLAVLAPVLIAFELAITVVAVAQGWGGQKVRGWGWVLRHLRWLRERRALVQAGRTVPDRDLAALLTDRFEPAQTPLPRSAAPLEGLLRAYWRLARRLLR